MDTITLDGLWNKLSNDYRECQAKEHYTKILTEYTNYICGKESYEEIIERISKKLYQKYLEIGYDEFCRKSDQFINMFGNEIDKN